MNPDVARGLPARYMEEVFNQRKYAVMDDLFDAPLAERLRQFALPFLHAFPDWQGTVLDVVVEGDRVVNRWSGRGTHLGDYYGMAPTGQHVQMEGITIFRVNGAKVVEEWTQADLLGLMNQLNTPAGQNGSAAQPASEPAPAEVKASSPPPGNDVQGKAFIYDRITSGSDPTEIANKAIIAKYVDLTNAGQLDPFGDLVDANYLEHDPIPGQGQGLEELKRAYKVFNGPFPDLSYLFEDLIAEGDLVFGRGVITGTHSGDFMGVPATGKKIRWTGTRLFRLKNLKVMEGWFNLDMLGMLQQMGVIPGAPPPDPANFPPRTIVTGAPSTREANKVLMHRLVNEVWNRGNLAVADEIYHPQHSNASAPTQPVGPEGVRWVANAFRSAFPDFHMSIDLMAAENDRVAARFTNTGTHLGEFFGVPGTGKKATYTEMGILRIADGKIVESWYDLDMAGLFQQLGIGG